MCAWTPRQAWTPKIHHQSLLYTFCSDIGDCWNCDSCCDFNWVAGVHDEKYLAVLGLFRVHVCCPDLADVLSQIGSQSTDKLYSPVHLHCFRILYGVRNHDLLHERKYHHFSWPDSCSVHGTHALCLFHEDRLYSVPRLAVGRCRHRNICNHSSICIPEQVRNAGNLRGYPSFTVHLCHLWYAADSQQGEVRT